MKRIVVLGLILGLSRCAFAGTPTVTVYGEEIVVTATRMKEKAKDSPVKVEVITREKIAEIGAKTVDELLRYFTTFGVAQRGGKGQSTSIFLRGANNGHTLVMIDGVEINDPSSTDRSAKLSYILVDDIERVEILYGPSGTIYGSDGMGGVINIITKKEEGLLFSVNGGDMKSVATNIARRGEVRGLRYGASFSLLETDGISAASAGTENDGYENRTLSLYLGGKPLSSVELGVNLRWTKAENEYDGWGGDDLDNIENVKNTIIQGEAIFHSFPWWKGKVKVSSAKTERANDEGINQLRTYLGTTEKIESQHNFMISGIDEMVIGAEYEKDGAKTEANHKIEIDKSVENKAVYLQNNLKIGRCSLRGGFRIDDNETFGSYRTHHLSSLISSPGGIRLRSSWSEGFKSPSLFQLYALPLPSWSFLGGNPNLKPEECENLELGIGIEKKYLGLEVTHFKNEFKNLITYYTDPATGQSTYKNIGSATTEGDEFTLSVMPTEDISILLNLTLLTKAKDNATGERLLLRPERRANLNIRWKPSEKVTLFIDEIYVGERLDYGNVELPKYTLFNTRISYRLSETLTLSGRIENLFDKKYEEVKGYGTLGRSLYGGIRLEL